MALATSARSILLTISKLLSGMECRGQRHCQSRCQNLRRRSKSPDCHAEGVPLESPEVPRIAHPKHVHLRVTEEALSAKAARGKVGAKLGAHLVLSLIHISEPTRLGM